MKPQTILAAISILLICFALSIACNAQPRNLQAKVFEITKQEKRRLECKAISMQGDTIAIRYGFKGWRGNIGQIKPGTWITIQSDYSDKYEEWHCKRIYINE
jgi:hypothetical protein